MTVRPTTVRLVLPHQLFVQHLEADADTVFVLVEHDLLLRHYRFHTHKLVLHRASMRRFADRLESAGFTIETIESDGRTTSRAALARTLGCLAPPRVELFDVVDDWLGRDLRGALSDAGFGPDDVDVLDTPNFLTTRAELAEHFDGTSGPRGKRARMQDFYRWQRHRLDVLVHDGEPAGGRWSFDEDNRKKLPKNHPVPQISWPERHERVDEAIAWVGRTFPDNPGDPGTFRWPTSHDEAEAMLEDFLAERLDQFGPYEDAISARHPYVFHGLLTPGLNVGLLDPRHVLERALDVGERDSVPLASLEGFVRQLIGWREYMRASYVMWGRRLRSTNHLGHTRSLADGWWTGETGLAPVDHVLRGVLATGYAHHIERLMVLGNAMCLLRTDPRDVHEWFMEMFIDAYDWVMVPNVHAMSQFATGDAITTKPYVSGANYLRTMSDLPRGDWEADWDALYWTFVRDHQEVFARNPRARMISSLYDRMEPATKAAHTRRADPWLA